MSVMTALRQRLSAKQTATVEDYAELARAVADAVDYDELSAMDILANAGKTVDDLESDAETLQQRRQLREQLDGLPELRAELADIVKPVVKLNQRIRKLQIERDELVRELFPEQTRLMGVVDGDAGLERRLRDSYNPALDPNGDADAEIESIRARLKTVGARRRELQSNISHGPQWAVEVERTKRRLESKQTDAERERLENQLQYALERLAEVEGKIAECTARMSELDAELTALDARKLAV